MAEGSKGRHILQRAGVVEAVVDHHVDES